MDAFQANRNINEHKQSGVPNGTTKLPSIFSLDQPPAQTDFTTHQSVVPPPVSSDTGIQDPIATEGLITQSLDVDAAQHEESDIRHTVDSSDISPEQPRAVINDIPADDSKSPLPVVNEAPTDAAVSAPASVSIRVPLDSETALLPNIPQPALEEFQQAEPINGAQIAETEPMPQSVPHHLLVSNAPTESVMYPDLGTNGVTDRMDIDKSLNSDTLGTTETSANLPSASLPDTHMVDADTDATAIAEPEVHASVETTLKQEINPNPLTIQTSLPAQSKFSHPRDEEEFEQEPATKRMRAEEIPLPMASNLGTGAPTVDTPTAIETPILPPPPPPQTPAKPQSRASSKPTSRAGSRAQSRASTPVPTSATSSYPTMQKTSNGNLAVPPDRDHDPELDQPLTLPQKKHLQRGIQNAKKGHHAGPFSSAVDPVLLNIPTYLDIIKRPMDLKTIDNRLKNSEYASVNDFLMDFDVMVNNSIRFNGPDHIVSQHGIHLRHAIDRNISNLPATSFIEPNASEKKAKKIAESVPPKRRESRSIPVPSAGNARSPTSNQTFALKSDGVPLIRRDSTVQDGRPRREIHPPAPKDLPYSSSKPKRKKFITELKFCDKVYEELMKPKYSHVSWAFQVPVDPVALNIPQYLKIIKKPMDMQTIGQKLKNGEYENAKEFEDDFKLMISNCLKFNPADHPVNQHGKDYESYFDQEWKGKAKWLKEHTPRSADQSPQSSDEEEDDEEEEEELEIEEEEDDGQLAKLQETLALVSAQITSLSQKKKKTPPIDKKKSKTKNVKKESKKAAPSKSTKKGNAGTSRKDKMKAISWEDKMSLSDRINDLNQDDMLQAMNIIRKGMPNLSVSLRSLAPCWMISLTCCKGANEEELELDIDELPSHVLFNLHNFVNSKSNKPVARAITTNHSHHSTNTTSSKPKKNRPMKKEEQEAKIRDLKNQLGRLSNTGYADADSAGNSSNVAENDESSGDDDSEESEED